MSDEIAAKMIYVCCAAGERRFDVANCDDDDNDKETRRRSSLARVKNGFDIVWPRH